MEIQREVVSPGVHESLVERAQTFSLVVYDISLGLEHYNTEPIFSNATSADII